MREVRNYVGGQWEERDGHDTEPVYDPATAEVVAETPLSTKEDVDRAVEAAQAAFPEWSSTPVVARTQVLFRYKMLLEEHFEELRDLVTLENGKDAKDAGGEVRRGIEVVEFACGMPTLMMGESVRDVASGVDNVSYRYPLGVVAAISPFNFPAMIPLWTLPVAIGAGNTYILKPSERTPLTAQRLGELLVEAGIPEGVFNIVNGAKEVVNSILEHPGYRGGLLCRFPAGSRTRLHSRHSTRKKGAGPRWCEELYDRHARCGVGSCSTKHHRFGLRQRRGAVPGW